MTDKVKYSNVCPQAMSICTQKSMSSRFIMKTDPVVSITSYLLMKSSSIIITHFTINNPTEFSDHSAISIHMELTRPLNGPRDDDNSPETPTIGRITYP